MPSIGVNGSVAGIINAAQNSADDIIRNGWGSPVDPDGSTTCHDKIAKRISALGTAQWKKFRSCVKDLAAISVISDIEVCIASAIAAATAEKGGAVIADITGGACDPGPIPANWGDGDCSGAADLAGAAQCVIDSTECEVCLAFNQIAGANADCSVISGIPCALLPGQHSCRFNGATDNSNLQLCFLGVCPSPFDIAGELSMICDPATQGGNGKRDCQCPLENVDPFVIAGVGTVCVTPVPCGDGEMDCDGGNALDVDMVADHNGAGSCTSNAHCASLCGTHCSGMGKSVYVSGCEGFCQGGTRADQSCICDSAAASSCTGGMAGINDCPNGSCEGKDNELGTSRCHCTCIDDSAGPAAPAGAVRCPTGLRIVIEDLQDGICNGNVIVNLPSQCPPLTSGSSTGVILDDNEDFGDLGPYTEIGAAGTCASFDANSTTGYEMVAVLAFYDSTIGDFIARLTINCQ